MYGLYSRAASNQERLLIKSGLWWRAYGTYFPHYGNFLLHKLNSCRRNYWGGEIIQGRKLFAEISKRYRNLCKNNMDSKTVHRVAAADFYTPLTLCKWLLAKLRIFFKKRSYILGHKFSCNTKVSSMALKPKTQKHLSSARLQYINWFCYETWTQKLRTP